MFIIIQNVKRVVLFTLLSLPFISCEKDKDNEPAISETFKVEGKSFTIKEGFIEDYGSYGVGENDTHYNYDFFLIDGDAELEVEEVSDFKAGLYFELFSPGTSGFTTGKFNFIDEEDINLESDIVGKHFFTYAEAYFDLDDDGVEDEESEYFYVIGGSITVSGGTNNNYTVEFDVKLDNNETIKGKFADTFIFIDGFAPIPEKSKKHFTKKLAAITQ